MKNLGLVQAPNSNEEDVNKILPIYGSDKAACFDLKADLKGRVIDYKNDHTDGSSGCCEMNNSQDTVFKLETGERVLIPTGFIFDIPEGFVMNIVSRSGLSWRNGVIVLNAPAKIDEDYADETFVILHNTSSEPFVIEHGDRVAQAELIPVYRVELESFGERKGGFGSSGVN